MAQPKRQNPPPVGQPTTREPGFTAQNDSSKQNNNSKKNKP
jgi:hypothetical protein